MSAQVFNWPKASAPHPPHQQEPNAELIGFTQSILALVESGQIRSIGFAMVLNNDQTSVAIVGENYSAAMMAAAGDLFHRMGALRVSEARPMSMDKD